MNSLKPLDDWKARYDTQRAEITAASSAQSHEPIRPVLCAQCGGEMVFNVPRLGPSGGYVHATTGSPLCACPQCGSTSRSALGTHCMGRFSSLPPNGEQK